MALPQQWFAVTGLKKADRKDMTRNIPGQIHIWGVDQDGVVMSTGKISETESQRTKRLGLCAYSVSTEPGYPGSPIVAYRNGRPVILGMHVCGNYFRRTCNYGLTSLMLQHFFRKFKIVPRVEVSDFLETRVDGGISTPENGSLADANELAIDFAFATEEQYEAALRRARDDEQEFQDDDYRMHEGEDQGEKVTLKTVKKRGKHVNSLESYKGSVPDNDILIEYDKKRNM